MAVERTLSIIKPDATRRNLTGQINARLEEAGLRIVAQRRVRLTPEQARTELDKLKADEDFQKALTDANHKQHAAAVEKWNRLLKLVPNKT